jgi:hypothetical protein
MFMSHQSSSVQVTTSLLACWFFLLQFNDVPTHYNSVSQEENFNVTETSTVQGIGFEFFEIFWNRPCQAEWSVCSIHGAGNPMLMASTLCSMCWERKRLRARCLVCEYVHVRHQVRAYFGEWKLDTEWLESRNETGLWSGWIGREDG